MTSIDKLIHEMCDEKANVAIKYLEALDHDKYPSTLLKLEIYELEKEIRRLIRINRRSKANELNTTLKKLQKEYNELCYKEDLKLETRT